MVASPVTDRRFPGQNKFKLGLFSFNTYGGLTNTMAKERWQANWPNMCDLAIMAEESGIEFLLPLAGWMGHNGDAPTDGHFHETMSWAAGLLSATKSIHVFATIHAPFLNPVFAAKQSVTCDHIGSGRLGLNLVAGYNEKEFDMFGVPYFGHSERYAYLEDWLSVVRKIWLKQEAFSHQTEFFNLKDVVGFPKPFGNTLPMVVSAGSSPEGRAFALSKADALFMVVKSIETLADDIRPVKLQMGNRPIKIYCSGHVICRRSKHETDEYYKYLIHDNGDWAAGRYMQKSYEEIKSVPIEILKTPEFLARLMSGHGTLPIVGNPEQVTKLIIDLHKAGLDGLAFALPNYLDDFPLFAEEVIPRLIEAGLRD
tara:strand:+ start:353 stop:1459 length:1107 start_codon:yes stop_codon:yes gene_type:complete